MASQCLSAGKRPEARSLFKNILDTAVSFPALHSTEYSGNISTFSICPLYICSYLIGGFRALVLGGKSQVYVSSSKAQSKAMLKHCFRQKHSRAQSVSVDAQS